jgi:hypothetical protein
MKHNFIALKFIILFIAPMVKAELKAGPAVLPKGFISSLALGSNHADISTA